MWRARAGPSMAVVLNTATTVVDPDLLRSKLTGALVTPFDPGWDEARLAWNLAADQHPAAVAVPRTVQDVVEVVTFANAHGLKVAPQGTGHNATAHASLSGAILLKTHELRGVAIDAEARTARVQAGDQWVDVTAPASDLGLAPISGSAPDVGVVGFMTGGGIGWLSRKFGLCSDSVLAVEAVLADGRVVRADAETEPELFWALRGGTGSFAVITALELQLFEVGPLVSMGAMLWPWERAGEVLEVWRQWTKTAPDEVTTSARLLQLPPLEEIPEPLRGGQFVIIDGAVVGMDEDAANALLAPLRDLRPQIDMWSMQPPANLCYIHMDPPEPMPGLSDTLLLEDVDAEAIAKLVEVAGPGSGSPLLMAELRHLGGALGRRREGCGALGAIDAEYLYFAAGVPVDADVICALQGGFSRVRNVLGRLATGRHYPNFREQPAEAADAYGPEVFSRLQAVKEAYDPTGVILANHRVTARD